MTKRLLLLAALAFPLALHAENDEPRSGPDPIANPVDAAPAPCYEATLTPQFDPTAGCSGDKCPPRASVKNFLAAQCRLTGTGTVKDYAGPANAPVFHDNGIRTATFTCLDGFVTGPARFVLADPYYFPYASFAATMDDGFYKRRLYDRAGSIELNFMPLPSLEKQPTTCQNRPRQHEAQQAGAIRVANDANTTLVAGDDAQMSMRDRDETITLNRFYHEGWADACARTALPGAGDPGLHGKYVLATNGVVQQTGWYCCGVPVGYTYYLDAKSRMTAIGTPKDVEGPAKTGLRTYVTQYKDPVKRRVKMQSDFMRLGGSRYIFALQQAIEACPFLPEAYTLIINPVPRDLERDAREKKQ